MAPPDPAAHSDWTVLALILLNRLGGRTTVHADEITAARAQLDLTQCETRLIAFPASIFDPMRLTIQVVTQPRDATAAVESFLNDVFGDDPAT